MVLNREGVAKAISHKIGISERSPCSTRPTLIGKKGKKLQLKKREENRIT